MNLDAAKATFLTHKKAIFIVGAVLGAYLLFGLASYLHDHREEDMLEAIKADPIALTKPQHGKKTDSLQTNPENPWIDIAGAPSGYSPASFSITYAVPAHFVERDLAELAKQAEKSGWKLDTESSDRLNYSAEKPLRSSNSTQNKFNEPEELSLSLYGNTKPSSFHNYSFITVRIEGPRLSYKWTK